MASEEAALRAKIQAMKNLLQAKQHQSSYHVPRPPHAAHYAQRTFPTRSYHAPVNRSWNRFSNGNTTTSSSNTIVNNTSSTVNNATPYYGSVMSANKVWRKEDADGAAKSASSISQQPQTGTARINKTWKRPLKVAASSHKYQSLLVKRARSRMQLQVLKLEDGDYAKANGGFSLIRAGVKPLKPTAAVANALKLRTLAARLPNSVNIGGANYVVTRRGNSLKRLTGDDITKLAAVTKQQSALSVSVNAASTTSRAQAAVLRARNARLKKKHAVQVRTEYCSFFNRFGKCDLPSPSSQRREKPRHTPALQCLLANLICPYVFSLVCVYENANFVGQAGYCNKRNECLYIHDSRRVAICRKFLRSECADANCLLSHKHDQNKMPVCALFLRGACTRDDCKYRHVKVSRSALVCQAFLKGFCADGEACRLKHELPPKKEPSAAAVSSQGKSVTTAKQAAVVKESEPHAAEQENQSPHGIEAETGTSTPAEPISSGGGGLSIRPNIRFRPKNASGFLSLFSARSALSN